MVRESEHSRLVGDGIGQQPIATPGDEHHSFELGRLDLVGPSPGLDVGWRFVLLRKGERVGRPPLLLVPAPVLLEDGGLPLPVALTVPLLGGRRVFIADRKVGMEVDDRESPIADPHAAGAVLLGHRNLSPGSNRVYGSGATAAPPPPPPPAMAVRPVTLHRAEQG